MDRSLMSSAANEGGSGGAKRKLDGTSTPTKSLTLATQQSAEFTCFICKCGAEKASLGVFLKCRSCAYRGHAKCCYPQGAVPPNLLNVMSRASSNWRCYDCKCCQLCNKNDKDNDNLLLCDGCDAGEHMGCQQPPLRDIPPAPWYCCTCRVPVTWQQQTSSASTTPTPIIPISRQQQPDRRQVHVSPLPATGRPPTGATADDPIVLTSPIRLEPDPALLQQMQPGAPPTPTSTFTTISATATTVATSSSSSEIDYRHSVSVEAYCPLETSVQSAWTAVVNPGNPTPTPPLPSSADQQQQRKSISDQKADGSTNSETTELSKDVAASNDNNNNNNNNNSKNKQTSIKIKLEKRPCDSTWKKCDVDSASSSSGSGQEQSQQQQQQQQQRRGNKRRKTRSSSTSQDNDGSTISPTAATTATATATATAHVAVVDTSPGAQRENGEEDGTNVPSPTDITVTTGATPCASEYESMEPCQARSWTVDQVTSFFKLMGYEEISGAFKREEIDGPALLLLQRHDVICNFGIKLGPALKVFKLIEHIQESVRYG